MKTLTSHLNEALGRNITVDTSVIPQPNSNLESSIYGIFVKKMKYTAKFYNGSIHIYFRNSSRTWLSELFDAVQSNCQPLSIDDAVDRNDWKNQEGAIMFTMDNKQQPNDVYMFTNEVKAGGWEKFSPKMYDIADIDPDMNSELFNNMCQVSLKKTELYGTDSHIGKGKSKKIMAFEFPAEAFDYLSQILAAIGVE